jgi:hypothetical protein
MTCAAGEERIVCMKGRRDEKNKCLYAMSSR